MGESNESGGKVELKRTMSLPMIVVFGLAYLSPTTIFAYYGISTVGSSGMMTMACAITTVAMLFTAWSYVQMSQVFPNAGSVYTYTQHAIGPQVGFMAGWVMLLDYLIIPMECFLLMSIYINAYFPAIPKWACLLVLVGISAVINVIGMEMSSIIDTVIVAADVIVLFLFIIVVLKYVTGGGIAHALQHGPRQHSAEEGVRQAVAEVAYPDPVHSDRLRGTALLPVFHG